MKILTIINEKAEQQSIELLEELKEEHQVEVVKLAEEPPAYDELVEKIEKCDRVISW